MEDAYHLFMHCPAGFDGESEHKMFTVDMVYLKS